MILCFLKLTVRSYLIVHCSTEQTHQVLTSNSSLPNMTLMGEGRVAALSSCWKRLNWSPSEEAGRAMI